MNEFLPNISIMHISDIHRTPEAPISNSELVSSLVADVRQYDSVSPKIKNVDAIVCSGDLVQGILPSDPDYPNSLKKQYDEAYEFTAKLADTFLDGDRSKLVIVSGNHDVNWKMAYDAMAPVTVDPKNVRGLLEHNDYRWDWSTLTLYRIRDWELYRQRLNNFRDFFSRFYKDCGIVCKVEPEFQYALFEISDDVIIAGFNSCDGNDCFNFSGSISRDAISECHLHIEQNYPLKKLRVAAWHHDYQGSPYRTDYMDKEVVELLFSKGFRIGIHGHQHKSESYPFQQYYQDEQIMTIVSAGSLTAGKKELPQGFNRQYNVLEMQTESCTARVHIREMLTNGCFTNGRHLKMGGKSHIDLNWSPYQVSTSAKLSVGRGDKVVIAENVELLISKGEFAEALEVLESTDIDLGEYGKRLRVRCLDELEKWDEFLKYIPTPRNPLEFGITYKAKLKLNKLDELQSLLDSPLSEELVGTEAVKEFKNKLRAEKNIRERT